MSVQHLSSAVRTSLSGHGASRPLNVLIETVSFDKGGLEKVVLDMALELDPSGFSILIVTPGPVGELAAIAKKAGIRVVKLPPRGSTVAYRILVAWFRPDVAITHYSDVGYRIFARAGVPNITFIHNVYAFFSDEMKRNFKNNDRFVNRYISVSANATAYLTGQLGIVDSKISTIPNGLIIAEHEARLATPFKLSRSDLGLAETDYVYANIASYVLYKGYFLMADAMKLLLKDRKDIKILCVGSVVSKQVYEKIRAYLRYQGLEQHMLLVGHISDIVDIHRISDAFLLPSFIEGWSIAMNEAMFYQKPMILTDTGGSRAVIEDEDIGILIPNEYGDTANLTSERLNALASNPQKYQTAIVLAEAMGRMADDRENWRERAKRGRQKIQDRYDFSRNARELEALIVELARSATKGS